MTSLGLVGIADKGTYNAEATYNKGQFVLYDGSTWLALKDNLNGVTPAEGENWKYLARGFAAELLSLVTAIDSQGLSGSQGGQVNAQSLIDVLADKVANQLIAKSMMSNVQVNDAEKVPTSALAYAMQQSIETLNSKMRIYTSIPSGKSTFFDLPSGIYLLMHGYSYPLTDKPKDALGSSIWIYQNSGGDERIGILLTSEATTSHVFIGYQYGGLSKLTWISLT